MKSRGAGWLWPWCATRVAPGAAIAGELAGFETGVLAGVVPGLDRVLGGVGAPIQPGA